MSQPSAAKMLASARRALAAGTPADAYRVAVPLFQQTRALDAGIVAIEAATALYLSTHAKELALALIRLYPGQRDAWLALGEACATSGEFPEAVEAFRRALRFGTDARTLSLLGRSLVDAQRYDEAEMPLRKALALDPDDMKTLTAIVSSRRWRCFWTNDGVEERYCQYLTEGRWKPGDLITAPSLCQLLPLSEETLTRVNEDSAAKYTDFAASVRKSMKERFDHSPRRRGGDPVIRVGYVSAGLRNFPTGHLTRTLFRHHDRSRFRIHAYQHGPVDDSPFSEAIQSGVDVFRHVEGRAVTDIARTIHKDGIDILVDLKGYSSQAMPSIPALRPAPLQVNWLGFPGTWGDPKVMDYIIVDRTVLTDDELSHYAEQPVLMPHCYQPTDDSFCPLPSYTNRAEWDLPEDAIVFCAFNSLYKISPEFFAIWMDILKAVPGSVLWMLRSSAEQLRHLRQRARQHGVEPDRILFARRVDKFQHLARLPHADLALDSIPYGAHTTAADCLWSGLPILTLTGDTFASRVCASIVKQAGFPELIAADVDAFKARAIELATRPDELAALRSRLAEQRFDCPQFDTHRFARALESAFETMWQRYCKGEPVAPIEPEDAGPDARSAWYRA